jgi:hypothetical protein
MMRINQLNKFWKKVYKCKHEHLSPNYCEFINCSTPYCSGCETHCLDCGVYISKCSCGYNNGMSGWPQKRWRNIEIKKYYKGKGE